jgi:MFS family permease
MIVWSVTQIATGHWSDQVGRKPLIVAAMLTQAAALALLALGHGATAPAAAAVLLGLGTALVYPTLIAGTVADALGYSGAIALVAGLTAASGLWVLVDMPPRPAPSTARPLAARGD